MIPFEIVKEVRPDALVADGFDAAVIGYDSKERVIYSVPKILGILMKRDEMSHEEAEEYFDFNVEQAYVGEKTPLYAYTFDR